MSVKTIVQARLDELTAIVTSISTVSYATDADVLVIKNAAIAQLAKAEVRAK